MANPNPTPPPIHGRWKPGQSGNPKGSAPRKAYKAALELALAKLASDGNADTTRLEIAAAHVTKAKEGYMDAIKEFADRTDGKVPQAIGGTDELPPIKGYGWFTDSE